ncbi:hypothetical protein H2200_000101 [Cladophialophora chaetospira]|uniref:Transcription factor domain-containing protein n=1 Tax=Cladophialophora chaetospira TaxID=386627 RepID=A0AA38XMT1_9EURO|nr:hypothetical protein H2200_000101 [Cladophialophora chaetospira]
MANNDFLFLVGTLDTYSKSGKSRPRVLNADARSHAALAHHRRRLAADSSGGLDLKRSPSKRVIMPKKTICEEREVDTEYREVAALLTQDAQQVARILTPLSYSIDVLPGVPHRVAPGFAAAAEFHSVVNPNLIHAPVFHVFNVSNTFAKCYYQLTTHEVGLYAGIAVVNMLRDTFRPDFRITGPAPHVLRMIQVAMAKLRQYLVAVEHNPERRQIDSGSSDAALIAAVFLAHIANSFRDSEAFSLHRQGIKAMVDARGGLQSLGLDGMTKCSVLQFESWWTHLHDDTSVFDSHKPAYNPIYLSAPYSPATQSLLSRLPPGFATLARAGKIATDIIHVLTNIVSYQETIRSIHNAVGSPSRAHEAHLSSLPSKNRFDDFYQACSCLMVQGPHFEKYLIFALLLFVSVAFAPGESGRKFLACSHTAFKTPRACLTRDLPAFWLIEAESPQPRSPAEGAGEGHPTRAEVVRTTQECLIWMWLVLIESWRATDGADSKDATELERKFILRFPAYAAQDTREVVLKRFFWMGDLRQEQHRLI